MASLAVAPRSVVAVRFKQQIHHSSVSGKVKLKPLKTIDVSTFRHVYFGTAADDGLGELHKFSLFFYEQQRPEKRHGQTLSCDPPLVPGAFRVTPDHGLGVHCTDDERRHNFFDWLLYA